MNINHQKNLHKKTIPWKEQYENFREFLILNNVMPSSVKNEIQKSLYSWYHRQKTKYKLNELNEEEIELWEQLLEEFNQLL